MDRTLPSSGAICKPDRCSGLATASASPGGHTAHHQDMVSVGLDGTIRCSSPVRRSPRAHQQQQRQLKKRHAAQSACLYHDHETLTVSLVGQANVYGSPARAVSPQRSHRKPGKQQESGGPSCAAGVYVRLVSVGPSLGSFQPGGLQCSDGRGRQEQQHAASGPMRCPDPAAASRGSRAAALAQLRRARRQQQQQQQQQLPCDVEQQVAEKMCGRRKQGSGNHWSSRKAHKRQHTFLSDSGTIQLSACASHNAMAEVRYSNMLWPFMATSPVQGASWVVCLALM